MERWRWSERGQRLLMGDDHKFISRRRNSFAGIAVPITGRAFRRRLCGRNLHRQAMGVHSGRPEWGPTTAGPFPGRGGRIAALAETRSNEDRRPPFSAPPDRSALTASRSLLRLPQVLRGPSRMIADPTRQIRPPIISQRSGALSLTAHIQPIAAMISTPP